MIFEKDEVLTLGGRPFSAYTPYKNAWMKKLEPFFLKPYPVVKHRARLVVPPAAPLPALADLGFGKTDLLQLDMQPGMSGARHRFEAFMAGMADYHERRDYPALQGHRACRPICALARFRYENSRARRTSTPVPARRRGSTSWCGGIFIL